MELISTAPYVEDQRLYDFAATAAREMLPAGASSGRREAALLRRWTQEIRRTHAAVERRYAQVTTPPAACEWLLDNWYLVQREAPELHAALKQARHLRRCETGLMLLELCRCLLRAGQGQATEERCRLFLDGFQSVTVLRRAELVLFPAALRAAVIEEIACVCRDLPYAADTRSHAASLEALFGTLRLFHVLDPQRLLTGADVTGAILAADPGGVWTRMDRQSRQDYLRRLERLARREGLEESAFAKRLVQNARAEGRHVGFFLFSPPSPLRSHLYIAANLVLTLLLSLLPALACRSAAAGLLLLLPTSELVKSLLDALLLHFLPPSRPPRIDTEKGVPEEGRTLCVVSLLLLPSDSAESLGARLEELRMACRREGEALCFGLLADLPAADSRETPADAACLAAARQAVEELNRKYGGGFYLFTRPRSFDGEQWVGQERKRGALLELAKLLDGRESSLELSGDREALRGVRYLLTLDSDTRLYPGAAGELIGAMLHPLATPEIDPEKHVVTRGFAVLQPRLDTELASANATDFSLVFAGAGGSDPYGGLCGELYMDAFGRSGFAGKGILDVQALLECSDAHIPPCRVLSHDALEGACLRGGFLGDAAFSDRFPTRPLTYYKRMHRWIRGDWQNLPWVFCRDFSLLDRWSLLDNLRRSLLPPMTLLAILAGFFLPGSPLAVSAWAALLALLSRLLICLAQGSVRRREAVRLRRYTRLLTGVGGAIVQTFLRLWLLPFEAWICLSAALTALWRMTVSHKRMLQWQTAAQSENAGTGLSDHLLAMWSAVLLGLVLLFASPVIIGRSAGLLWLLSPLLAAALALPAYREAALNPADRAYLLQACSRHFAYYQSFCTAEDHFLPPDNFQEEPPIGLAHRTSPTNIGLAMASCLAAREMALIESPEALERIGRIVSTLEQMPRHLGHYYNWYDTRTLRPLEPAYLSTVDSGNLYACLLVLRQALPALGDSDLARRIDVLMGAMDFAPLYDRDRGLFHICYDPRRGQGLGGWYDLMASEAMLTSYLAVAKGDVPLSHWRRLSRAQLQKDGYRGLASWTGTMFEYLMPSLFLPLYRGSLLAESGRFCLYVQKRRAFAGKPWGISESAFYSLDSALNYRYKASGCQALALKRGQDADMVISPYSSFLALAVDAPGAVRNLRRLERCGAVGRLGFREALDLTPERCRGREGEIVRCYMAHHIGMSILAAANILCGDSIRRLFFSDAAMSAHKLLLQERLPDSGLVIRRDSTRVPERLSRGEGSRWQLQGSRDDKAERCCLFSNGVYSVMSTNYGRGFALCRGLTVYGTPDAVSPGIELRVHRTDSIWSLAPAERLDTWLLTEDACVQELSTQGLTARVERFAAAGELGELHSLRLTAQQEERVEITFSLRPVLARYEDYVNHPSYWKLGMVPEQTEDALLLHRLRRGGRGDLWLCLRASLPARFDAGEAADPLLTLHIPLSLQPDTPQPLCVALCLAWERQAALDGAARMLARCDRASLIAAAAQRMRMSPEEVGESMAMLPDLLRPVWEAAPRKELWPYGISGDLPLLCCSLRSGQAMALLRRFCLLKSGGIEADLVYLSEEYGEYQQPFQRQIEESLDALGLAPLLGSRGGVHFAPQSAANPISSRAALVMDRLKRPFKPLRLPCLSAPRLPRTAPDFHWNGTEFQYYVNSSLPARAWQQMLSNGRLSAIMADCGPMGLWLHNARELRLTAAADPRAPQGTELLWADTLNGPVSLFAANDGLPCRVSYGPGWAQWVKEIEGRTITTQALIPEGQDFRVLILQGAGGLHLNWSLQPLLGPDSSSLRCRFSEGVFFAENPECPRPDTLLLAASNSPCSCRTLFTPPAMQMSMEAKETAILVCGCGSRDDILRLCKPSVAREAFSAAQDAWARRLSAVRVETGDTLLDHMLPWAAYQAIVCRLWGRGSLYQSGGALGFRDQLQDAVNLLLLDPAYARDRIADCCRHQYVEGDVMHWWHPQPDGDKGIRSRCSDDLLWLVWALCEYAEATGDLAFCEEEINYVNSPVLAPEERDRYEQPEQAQAAASVLFHAKAALECCLHRGFGPHGLPWMGSGDWNDGLDAVDGESVWLGFFLAHCAARFAALLEKLDKPDAQRYRDRAHQALCAARAAWNGRWYRRGYWADSRVLGGDARIDALPQAWAALCEGAGVREDAALDAALEKLVDEEHGLVRLFTPPFSDRERYPGYLAAYGEGFRENGGQYTHGALWLAMACLRRGRTEDALHLLQMLLPASHDAARYEAEPYVLPADVSAAPGSEGCAGWTWYTGSAAWFFRIVCEELLGLRLEDGHLTIRPRLPDYRAAWTDRHGTVHTIRVRQGEVLMDGHPWEGRPPEKP